MEVRTAGNYEAFVLPEGSQVFMNQHNSISYQVNFNPGAVNLSREMFFTIEPYTSILYSLNSLRRYQSFGYGVQCEAN